MASENYNVIGVMSGTSLDGVDFAHILFTYQNGKWDFVIKECATVPYTKEWTDRLRKAVDFSEEELILLNKEYTFLLGEMIHGFINGHQLSGLDAVCSHGHTVLHKPKDKITLQIGNMPEIAAIAKQRVVCDFRVQDVELGGQGAPLVPIGDRLLFTEYDYCLNLGGFSNISFEEDGKRIAFDVSPVNTVLNHYAMQLGYAYDDGGKLASRGNIDNRLLGELNAIDYYNKAYPKSLGFEFVKETILPIMERFGCTPEDKLRTFAEHAAQQIARVISGKGEGHLLVTGGGAYNTLLIEQMKRLMPQTSIVIPDDKTIQFKEALIFALLGVLKLRGEVNVLASVTGAAGDHCAGFIYEP